MNSCLKAVEAYRIIILDDLFDHGWNLLVWLISRLFDVGRRTKIEVTHDVKHKTVNASRQLYSLRPVSDLDASDQNLIPLVNMARDKLASFLRHSLIETDIEILSSFTVFRDVDGGEGRLLIAFEYHCFVKVAAADVGFVVVNLVVCFGVAKDHSVGLWSKGAAVDLKLLPEPDMALSTQGVDRARDCTGTAPEWSGYMGEWVKIQVVDNSCNNLVLWLV